MVEYLSGGRIQGSSTLASSPPQTSWKEIGRFKLSSASDTITVKGLANATSGTLADKDNIMILGHTINSGNTNVFFRCNGDNQQNYAENGQINGGTNYTQDDQTQLDLSGGAESKPMFIVQNIVNVPAQEKLIISETNNCATGSGNAPNRIELVGKWESPSNTAIQSVSFNNTSTGDYATDSEIVVLGCDNDEADSGTNFWQQLASVSTSSSGSELSSGTITAKKYLMFEATMVGTNGTPKSQLAFNASSGGDYSDRYSTNSGAESGTHTDDTSIMLSEQDQLVESVTVGYIINKSDSEKLVIAHNVNNTGAGEGTVPNKLESVGKWDKTDQAITSIQLRTHSGTFSSASLKVWGSD